MTGFRAIRLVQLADLAERQPQNRRASARGVQVQRVAGSKVVEERRSPAAA